MSGDLVGKTILITGATDGIGKAAATTFAKRGATLTILGRNKPKTERVLSELKAASGNENLDLLVCDLSRMAEVRRAAEAFKARHDRLDVLVNNAGATFRKPQMGPDGVELTFALNHLAYFQLTTSLLDLLRRTDGARIVSTSSSMQARGRLDLATTPTSLEGWGPNAYATSKLANILFTKELQRRLEGLEGTTATANCFEPGMVRTQFGGMGSDQGFLLNLVYTLAKPFASTPEEGADSLLCSQPPPKPRRSRANTSRSADRRSRRSRRSMRSSRSGCGSSARGSAPKRSRTRREGAVAFVTRSARSQVVAAEEVS